VKKNALRKTVIKVGYVGYRDFDDIGTSKDHLDIFDYTDDLEVAKK
jgi:hypothetical protein